MAQKKITDLTLRSSFDETVNLAGDDTSQTYRVTGQQIRDFITSKKTWGSQLENLTLASSVAASALTIAVKTQAGANASSTDPINVGMRSATLTSGVYNMRQITGALSLVISSGSTLGQVDGQPSRIYVYLIDNSGTLELAASHKWYPEDSLVSTTAEGGAGAADSATAIYSSSARSNVPIRCIGYIDNTQATAGTWASAGTEVQLKPTQNFKAPTIQRFTSSSGTYYTPAGVKYIKVKMVGGGAGGCGGGATTSGDGGDSTFGSSLLTAGKGNGGASGAGGSVTINSPALTLVSIAGVKGTGGGNTSALTFYEAGGPGASTPFGGAGGGGAANTAGTAAATNSGSGGGGGGTGNAQSQGGQGGSSAGYLEALIADPLASYAYEVGSAGSAGTGTQNGAAGGSGVIIVEEYYN